MPINHLVHCLKLNAEGKQSGLGHHLSTTGPQWRQYCPSVPYSLQLGFPPLEGLRGWGTLDSCREAGVGGGGLLVIFMVIF